MSKWLEVAKNGLTDNNKPRKTVLILGAGMAGLTAAYELQRAGHTPIVLEAQNRLGGRVFTMRAPFAEGLHAEAGAMRIPKTHDLTHFYCDKFGLQMDPFTMGNPEAYVYVGGNKVRVKDYDANPQNLSVDFGETERGRTVQALWNISIKGFADEIAARGDDAWDEIVNKYDCYSTREFLEEQKWSEGAIELYGLLENQEASMNYSFVEVLREEIGECYVNLSQIHGGTDRLPYAFYPALASSVRFGAQVVALDQDEDSVTAHYRTLGGRFHARADYMICTIPFAVLRHIEILTPFTRAKERAIRELHYDASTKIFIQTRRRFWEEDDGIFGGGTVTDLAIRNLYYPEHGRETGRGVLLASYTWADDAMRWASLPPHDRLEQALENIAQIHPQIMEDYEGGASWSWHDDPYAGGAFALFEPEQQTLLYKHIVAPEGRIHFAGEHASLEHAWIQGAIESGLRAASEVNEQ